MSSKNFIERVSKALPQYKFDKFDTLGRGQNGTAYDIGNNIVLKLTTDQTEARASNVIKGKKLKYTNEIYDVFSFIDTTGIRLYLIFQKLLAEIDNKNINIMIDEFCDFLTENDNYWKPTSTESRIEKIIDSFFDIYKEQDVKFYEKFSKKRDFFKKLYTFILNSREELEKYKVFFYDYHSGNIMLDSNGDFKLIDLGYSTAPETEIELKVLESFKKFFNGRTSGRRHTRENCESLPTIQIY